MSEPITPFEMVGDIDAAVCVDGVCAFPTQPDPDDGSLLRTNPQVGSATTTHHRGAGD
jgi:hypothetical protein